MVHTSHLRLAAVHLVDSHYCSDPAKFISVCLTSLTTMLQVYQLMLSVHLMICVLCPDCSTTCQPSEQSWPCGEVWKAPVWSRLLHRGFYFDSYIWILKRPSSYENSSQTSMNTLLKRPSSYEYCTQTSKFIWILYSNVQVHMNTGSPTLQVLDLEYLLETFPEDAFTAKYKQLNTALTGLVSDYRYFTPLVTRFFSPLPQINHDQIDRSKDDMI